MAITQDFKNQCDALIKKWIDNITKEWSYKSWDDLANRARNNRNIVINDPFFKSLPSKTTEEQKYFFKLIQQAYDTNKTTDDLGYAVESSLRGNAGSIGAVAVIVFDLKNDYLKLIDVDKWDAEAVNWAKKYEEQWNYYKDNLRKDYLNNVPFHPDGLKEVKKVIDQLRADKLQLEQDKKTAEADRDAAKGELKTANEKMTTLEADKTNLNNQLTTANNSITTLTSDKQKAETDRDNYKAEATKWEGNYNKAAEAITGLQKDKSELETKLQEKDGEITKLNQQLSQQGSQAGQSAQYLNKLLAIYKTEITDETTTFYQSLKLDNNEVNAKYGNKDKSYLDLLSNLKGESEPDQVINAFKYVALILATEKAQAESDKWINESVVKIPAFKKGKYNAFNKIRENWDEMEEVAKPTELNNPLYLPIIKEKDTYKNQIETIINLWK